MFDTITKKSPPNVPDVLLDIELMTWAVNIPWSIFSFNIAIAISNVGVRPCCVDLA